MNKKILIVEDSKVINSVLYKKLSSYGFDVTKAYTFADAKKALDNNSFDFVILDLNLPDGDGIDVIFYIKSLKDTKVIVLTSSVDLQVREELFRYGILDYFIKDKNLLYSIEEIVKVIKRVEENKGEKILVIDDSPLVYRQIKKILEPRNYDVDSAGNGNEGIKKAKKNHYSLIILDMVMPDINGKEVLSILRREPKLNTTPIIALSGNVTPNIIREVLKNGANDFLQKPFVFEEFILKVDIWIDYFKKEKKIEEMAKKLEKINENLEEVVQEEIKKNKEKDKILFLQARHAQMGEAISMIAHQWKQPLNNIALLIGSMAIKVQFEKISKEEILQLVQKVNNNIKELSTVIDEFRNFFKPKHKKVKTTFSSLVNKSLELLEPLLKEKKVNVEVEEIDVKEIEVFENEVEQVIMNIIKNAVDALEENQVENPWIKITINKNRLEIEDNAGGIPEDIKDKIFDLYFSTKSHNGTGLGLYMSKIIIEHHCKGKLEVENTKNGAKFIIEC